MYKGSLHRDWGLFMILKLSATSLIGPRRAVNPNPLHSSTDQDPVPACWAFLPTDTQPQPQQHHRHVQLPEDGRCGIAGGCLHRVGSRREHCPGCVKS